MPIGMMQAVAGLTLSMSEAFKEPLEFETISERVVMFTTPDGYMIVMQWCVDEDAGGDCATCWMSKSNYIHDEALTVATGWANDVKKDIEGDDDA